MTRISQSLHSLSIVFDFILNIVQAEFKAQFKDWLNQRERSAGLRSMNRRTQTLAKTRAGRRPGAPSAKPDFRSWGARTPRALLWLPTPAHGLLRVRRPRTFGTFLCAGCFPRWRGKLRPGRARSLFHFGVRAKITNTPQFSKNPGLGTPPFLQPLLPLPAQTDE